MCVLGLSLCLLTNNSLQTFADWPQILGPNRDGHAASDDPLDTTWPKELPILWRSKIGSGFGGSAIVGNQVLTLQRNGSSESLIAHSLLDGNVLWECKWPATYRGRINPDEGPRCVPVVQGEFAFCYGAAGDLACVRIANGELVWRRALRNEMKADDGYFGAGSTPLAVDGLVIVCLGGQKAGIVAVDQASGKTRWSATENDASYASPIAIKTDTLDNSLALVVTRYETVLLDSQTGKVLSSVEFGSRGPTVNAATPIALGDDRYYLTASYGVGALTLSIKNNQTLVEESRNESLSSQYNTPVLVGRRIIGIDGREDAGVASLKAIDATTQELQWQTDNFGTAHLVAIGKLVLTVKLKGELGLLNGEAPRYELLASSQLPAGTYRALPAYSSKKLVLRRSISDTESELLCIDLP